MMVIDNETWIENQFADVQLADKRRNGRLKKVATNMLNAPEQSLATQNVDWSDAKAAYRLFANPNVTFNAVTQPHWQQTRQTKPGRYLLISDTTELDYTSHPATSGLQQIGNGGGQGMLLHSCLVYDCGHEQILGTAGARIHYRKKVAKKESRSKRLKRIRESQLWGQLVDDVGPAPQDNQWIHVFDRGGDNFEAMCHIQLTGCDWVIRASKLNRSVISQSGETLSLQEAVSESTALGSYELSLRSRPGVAARTAKIEVSSTRVTFPQPKHRSAWVKQCGIERLEINVVIVQEVGAPQGIKPIRWVLLSSLPAEKFEQAWQVIEDYENRWLIEEYHKVMKSGCRLQSHALRTADRLEPLIGLITVIGTRLLSLKQIGRSQPTTRALTHVPSSWLKCLKAYRGHKVKLTGMTVYSFFRELAKLGGFLARKGDGEPGWETVWRGYQKLQSLLAGMQLAARNQHSKCG